MSNTNLGPATTNTPNSIPLSGAVQLLFVLRGANMQVTTDQLFTKVFVGTQWDPQFIIANQVSGAFSSACAGGIYTAPSKGGTAITPAGQSYSTMTGSLTQVNCVVTTPTTTFTGVPILNLTTGNGAALFADFFIFGVCLD
jgi:hypothetical protein